MISSVVTHPVCDLDMRKRLREARVDALARSVRRANGRVSLLDKLLRRRSSTRTIPAAEGLAFADQGEDVWKALRF